MNEILLLFICTFVIIEANFLNCSAPECQTLVIDIKKNMNTTAKPCDDFYEFACGRWAENNPIPPDELRWRVFNILKKNALEKEIELFDHTTDDNGSDTTVAFRKAKKIYQNCMNTRAVEADGAAAIVSQLNKIGGWPVMMGPNDGNSRPLSEILAYYARDVNLSPLFDIFVGADAANSSTHVLYIDAAFLTPFDIILRDNDRNSSAAVEYEDLIAEVVKILANASGTDIRTSDVKRDAVAMVDFEYELLKIIPDISALSDRKRRHSVWTIGEFQLWYNNHSMGSNSKIVWIDTLRTVFNGTGVNFTLSDKIIISEREFMGNLAKLLDTTSMRTIVNYVQWTFVDVAKDAAPLAIRNLLTYDTNRKKMCLENVGLKHAIGCEFVNRYFSTDAKNRINEIITNMLNIVSTAVKGTSWLKADEKKIAQEKLRTMKRHIGYPDWYEKSIIDDYYQQYRVNENFLENIIEEKRFSKNISLSQLTKPVDKNTHNFNPLEVSAQYDRLQNAILLYAALLQPPLFSEKYPRIFQYAKLGAFVGHEISHAIDIYGSRFDKNGKSGFWWSNTTSATFASKVKCFVDQYNEYKVYDSDYQTVHADGDLTKDENIADLHGLKFAYEAYEKTKTLEDKNLRLPGLELHTDKQLFFLIFATGYCEAEKPEFYDLFSGSKHNTGRIRVKGVLSNMREFSDAFHCNDTDVMNPRNKCAVWELRR